MENKIPDLLLSYTYFLDSLQKSLISVGYDSNLLLPTIILINKTNSFKIIEFYIFMNIYKLREEINEYFTGNESGIIKINEFILSKNKQRVLTIRDCRIKINLKGKEWSRLYKLLPFISAVINYQHRTAYLVADYYESYLKQCLEQKVLKLHQPPILPYEIELNTSINYSRLFYELPIFCESKLFDDYFKNIIQESINSAIN